MYIVHVFIKVKQELIGEFKRISLENATNSLKETGVVRFDLIQEVEDTTKFLLVEIYKSKEDAASHKETIHYNRWREAAEPMMAEPRTRIIYQNIHPTDAGWK